MSKTLQIGTTPTGHRVLLVVSESPRPAPVEAAPAPAARKRKTRRELEAARRAREAAQRAQREGKQYLAQAAARFEVPPAPRVDPVTLL